jgi:hypothetical protein
VADAGTFTGVDELPVAMVVLFLCALRLGLPPLDLFLSWFPGNGFAECTAVLPLCRARLLVEVGCCGCQAVWKPMKCGTGRWVMELFSVPRRSVSGATSSIYEQFHHPYQERY